MKSPLIAIEKYRRLQSINPDGQYCITMNASGYYRVVGVEEKPTQQIDIDNLLSQIANQKMTEFMGDF